MFLAETLGKHSPLRCNCPGYHLSQISFTQTFRITSFKDVINNTETALKLPKKKSCNGQRCFSYRGAKMWNNHPDETKQASSLYVFKKLI